MKDLIKKYEELLVEQKDIAGSLKNEESIALAQSTTLILSVAVIDLKRIEKEHELIAKGFETIVEKYNQLNLSLDDMNALKVDDKGEKLGLLSRIKSLNIAPAFENNETLLLKRLVKQDIQKGEMERFEITTRKKYGLKKMNTLYSLEGKLKK